MIAAYFIVLVYCFLVFVLIYGWHKATVHTPQPPTQPAEKLISLIIPVRNEAHQIKGLLQSIREQTYKSLEVIIVDDHSEDILHQVVNDFNLANVVIIRNEGIGKKHAIATGVAKANGDIIVTTDADCSMLPTWIETMGASFHDPKIKLAFGTVRIQYTNNFFSSLQAIEFASLIGSGGAAAALGNPVMCNGANLAYRKETFIKVNGFEGNMDVPSGDDEFLMRKVYEMYPDGIAFIGRAAALVTTWPQPDMRSFFTQRIRWASKWKRNTSVAAAFLAVFIFVSQLAFLVTLGSLFFSFSWLALSAILIKFVLEGLFLTRVCLSIQVRWNWLAFITLQFLYPVYVLTTAWLSFILPYAWKGRANR